MGTTTFKGDGYTWTFAITSPITISVTDSQYTIPIPKATIRGQVSNYGTSDSRSYSLFYGIYRGSSEIDRSDQLFTNTVANSSTNATVPAANYTGSTWDLFSYDNPTQKSVSLPIKIEDVNFEGAYGSEYVLGVGPTVTTVTATLNAPPTIIATSVSGATSAGLFIKGISTAKFSSGYAQYGGTITSRKLTIGEQTAEVTSPTTVSIALDAVGTFTPIVQVTDSRGQTTTKTLSDITVIENVPTTFVTSGISSSTVGFWKDVSTASITVSDITVMEGYRATKVAFTVGNQTHTVELGDGETGATLSILLNEIGTFAPTVKVTDSRGIVTTRTFSDITVGVYTNTSIGTATLARTAANGLQDDEGAYGLLTMDVDYVYELGNLLEPIIEVTDNGATSSGIVTWYESWNSITGIDTSSLIDWTDYNPTSPVTLYGLISGYGSVTGFDTQRSFQIAVTARDTQTSSDTLTQILDSAFYTIDFLAGGHGIAFGQPASDDGFWCDMDMYLHGHKVPVIYESALAPTATDGEDGDIWIQYTV